MSSLFPLTAQENLLLLTPCEDEQIRSSLFEMKMKGDCDGVDSGDRERLGFFRYDHVTSRDAAYYSVLFCSII